MWQAKLLIPGDEFTIWQAEYALAPWGDESLILGQLAALYYNHNRRKTATAADPRDFIQMRMCRGIWERVQKPRIQSAEEMISVLDRFAAALKGASRGR